MTWYSPYNGYSNQLQYYYPYNYSSYHSTPYGMITDGSFQNRYYAVDGVNSSRPREKNEAEGALGGFMAALGVANVARRLGNIFGGGDDDDVESSTMTTIQSFSMTFN